MVTLVYWVTLYNPDKHFLDFETLSGHLLIVVANVLDVSISDRPWRLLHVFHSIVLAGVFSLIYFLVGGLLLSFKVSLSSWLSSTASLIFYIHTVPMELTAQINGFKFLFNTLVKSLTGLNLEITIRDKIPFNIGTFAKISDDIQHALEATPLKLLSLLIFGSVFIFLFLSRIL